MDLAREAALPGGVAGGEGDANRRKFVIDFAGGRISELPEDAPVVPDVSAVRGRITQSILSRVDGTGIWRLVIEVEAEAKTAVELRASLTGFDQVLSETWLYQWVKE